MRGAAPSFILAIGLTAGCTLAFPLDDLQDGDGAGASGPSSSSGNPTTSNMTSSGGGATTTTSVGTGGGGGGATYADAILADGPLLYFRMSAATDEPNLGTLAAVASATHVSPHGTVSTVVPGSDAASTYDDPTHDLNEAGEDDTGHLDVPALVGFFGNAQPFSIELWARLPAPDDVVETADLVRSEDSTGGFRLRLGARLTMTGKDSVSFGFKDAASAFDDFASYCNFDDWVDGVPRHFVAVFDPTATPHPLAIYVDGIRCDTLAAPAGGQTTGAYAFPAFEAPLAIGTGWSGSVDEVALYDVALTPGQICAHLAAGGGSCN